MARYPPLSTGLACPAEAARITLLRNATAAGLLQAICTCLYVSASVYMWSQNVRRLAYSFLPHRLWPAGRGLRGQSDLRYSAATVSIIPLGSCSGGGLAGRTAAAAGFGWTCWRSQECSAPSRNLCNSKPILSSRHLLKLCNKFFFPTSFFLNKFFQSIKALGLQYNWRCMPFC